MFLGQKWVKNIQKTFFYLLSYSKNQLKQLYVNICILFFAFEMFLLTQYQCFSSIALIRGRPFRKVMRGEGVKKKKQKQKKMRKKKKKNEIKTKQKI